MKTKQLIHLLKWEIRFLWKPLLLWATALIVYYGSAAAFCAGDDPAQGKGPVFLVLFFLFIKVAQAELIAHIVLKDPVTDSRAFWMTQAVSGSRMLAVKTTVIIIFVLGLPLTGEMFVLVLNGIPFDYILSALPELILMQMIFIASLTLVAALNSRRKTFSVIQLLLMGVVLFITWVQGYLTHLEPSLDNSLNASRLVMASVPVILFSTAAVVCQYLTRRRVLTFFIGAAGLILMALLWSYWQYDFIKKTVPASSPNPALEKITLQLPVKSGSRGSGKFMNRRTESLVFECRGIQPGYLMTLGDTRNIRMTFNGQDAFTGLQTVIPEATWHPYGYPGMKKWLSQVMGDVAIYTNKIFRNDNILPEERWEDGYLLDIDLLKFDDGINVSPDLTGDSFSANMRHLLTYTSEVRLNVCSYRRLALVPLETGRVADTEPDIITLSDVRPFGGGVHIKIRVQRFFRLVFRICG